MSLFHRLVVTTLFLAASLTACNGHDPAPPQPATLIEGPVTICLDGGLPPCR